LAEEEAALLPQSDEECELEKESEFE